MSGAWQNCCCSAGTVKQFASVLTHNTFGWSPVPVGFPRAYDWHQHYSRGQVVDTVGGASCTAEFAFFGLLNRVIVKRTYAPDQATWEAARAAWVPDGPTDGGYDVNSFTFIWGSRSTIISGLAPVDSPVLVDEPLLAAVASAVDWAAIPPNWSYITPYPDINRGYTNVPDFSGPTLLGLLAGSLNSFLATQIPEGPTSVVDLQCPARYQDGLNQVTITSRLDIEYIGNDLSQFPPSRPPIRAWGRYRGTFSATKVDKTHSEVAYAWMPDWTLYVDPFENNPWDADCALTRSLVEFGRYCALPGRIVLPPTTPGLVLIPTNPAAFPC